jgi:hypothetical protein
VALGTAATVKYQSDAELIAGAARVVRARVLGARGERGAGGRIYTVTTLEVLEDFTGESDSIIEVRELGGRVGNEFLWVGGGVHYEPGTEIVVCLERSSAGWLRSTALGFSKFDVEPTADGDALLRRNLANIDVAGGQNAGIAVRLSSFRRLAERVRGRRSVAPPRSPGAEALSSAQEPYTLLTFGNGRGGRWIEADTSTPVRYFIDTSAPAPVPGDAMPELQTALNAWTNPPQASIVLAVGGFTDQVDTGGPWPSLGSGAAVIFFEDPNDEINGNVLAVGGGWGSENDGGTVNGTVFNRLRSGFVLFQNASALSSNFRQSQDFTRVLEHEIGHTIGLGHTQDTIANPTSNIMYPSCCTTATPIAPAIGPDDLAGLTFIYPASGCTYALSSNSTQVPALASSFNVTVTTQAGCSWTVTGNPPWVTPNPTSGTGSGTVQVSIATNSTTSGRNVTLAIGGEPHTITQAACTCTISPTVAPVAAIGGTVTITVAANSCVWTSLSPVDWIVVTSGSSGSGAGTVTLSVARNIGPPRSALVRIAGQLVNVSQPDGTRNSTTADFNGDGHADLVWHHQGDGRISVWHMNGVSLISGTLLTPDRVADTHWKIVGVWDPNGDGSPDLLWRNDANGSLANWRLQGTTRISGDPLSPGAVADLNWQIAAVADLNHDGRLDLVWQHVTQGLLSVWLMNGTTLVDGRLLTPSSVADTNWRIVGSGDFNLDGNADLVWQHRTSGQASIWFMNGTNLVNGVLLSPPGVADTNWQIRAVTDLNTDGQPDLVWQNVATGYLAAWLMNGTSMVEGIYLSPSQVADTGWRIVGPR